jgi:nucleoside-diphosphate-sugar epimerase
MTDTLNNFISEDCKRSCTDIDMFSILKDQCILVTGGTGFMGKWIAEMISYVNQNSDFNIKLYLLGRDIQKFKNEVPHLGNQQFIHLMEQDVRNIHDLAPEINYIIHAAGSPDNREHVSQPLRTIETFYRGTQAVLDAASRLPELKKLIHISSHQVYGTNNSEELISEQFLGKVETNSVNHLYAESKRVSETLCSVYRTSFRLPILTIRPFAFIGPYHDLEKPWAINNFIRDGILGSPIRIIGNGDTIRSYLYASDMAYWILAVLVNGQIGENYNMGSQNPISLNQLAEKVRDSINKNIEIVSKSSKESYTSLSRLVPNTVKIMKHLNVQETKSLDESITRTIVWNQLSKK